MSDSDSPPPRRYRDRNETKARVRRAISFQRANPHMPERRVAERFGVSYGSFRYAINKMRPSSETKRNRSISDALEQEIVKYLTEEFDRGFPVPTNLVRLIATSAKRELEPHSKALSATWHVRFIGRHPGLEKKLTESFEYERKLTETRSSYSLWFEDLNRVTTAYNIKPQNLYYMGETGFAHRELRPYQVIDPMSRKGTALQSARSSAITLVACVCADGTDVTPTLIFKGTTLMRRYYTSEKLVFDMETTENGWITTEVMIRWLERFEPMTSEKANDDWRLLVIEGHSTDISKTAMAFCWRFKIKVLIMPPHSSCLLQPLDVRVFGPLKNAFHGYYRHLSEYITFPKTQEARAAGIAETYKKLVTEKVILDGFKEAGIHPFNAERVLEKLPPHESTSTDTAPSESTKGPVNGDAAVSGDTTSTNSSTRLISPSFSTATLPSTSPSYPTFLHTSEDEDLTVRPLCYSTHDIKEHSLIFQDLRERLERNGDSYSLTTIKKLRQLERMMDAAAATGAVLREQLKIESMKLESRKLNTEEKKSTKSRKHMPCRALNLSHEGRVELAHEPEAIDYRNAKLQDNHLVLLPPTAIPEAVTKSAGAQTKSDSGEGGLMCSFSGIDNIGASWNVDDQSTPHPNREIENAHGLNLPAGLVKRTQSAFPLASAGASTPVPGDLSSSPPISSFITGELSSPSSRGSHASEKDSLQPHKIARHSLDAPSKPSSFRPGLVRSLTSWLGW